MGITADQILKHGLIDSVLPEPLGGAHRDLPLMASTLKDTLLHEVYQLKALSMSELISRRYEKWMAMGACE